MRRTHGGDARGIGAVGSAQEHTAALPESEAADPHPVASGHRNRKPEPSRSAGCGRFYSAADDRQGPCPRG